MPYGKPVITQAVFQGGKIKTCWSYDPAADWPTAFVVTVSIPGEYVYNTQASGLEALIASPVTRPGNTFVQVTPMVDQGAVSDAVSDLYKVDGL